MSAASRASTRESATPWAMRFEVSTNGTLADPNIIMPAVLEYGNDLEISFAPIDNAQWYHVTLQYIPDEGDTIDLVRYDEEHETSYTFDKSLIEKLP